MEIRSNIDPSPGFAQIQLNFYRVPAESEEKEAIMFQARQTTGDVFNFQRIYKDIVAFLFPEEGKAE